MKKALLLLIFLFAAVNIRAQAPTIEGDLMLCPYSNGTAEITNNQTYDSYQWYFKYWFLPDEYQPIPEASTPSFTYDWMTYDQALLKVVVTLNGLTYESNVIQIDSWNWTGIVLTMEENENVTFDPDTETFLLCQGADFELSVNNPPYDTNIVWYKDDVAIPGANLSSYTVTEPGTYNVSAAPGFCPDNSNNAMGITVAWDTDCNLDVVNPGLRPAVAIFPNPVKNEIFFKTVSKAIESYTLFDMTGKIVAEGKLGLNDDKIAVDTLSNGMYILKLTGESHSTVHKIVKE